MRINYAFIRHGHGCHNAVKPLLTSKSISYDNIEQIKNLNVDPTLSELGVNASINNGCIISKIILDLRLNASGDGDEGVDMSTINIVGCSPLIRSMETAYYMTRKWKNPPTKIYVFPYLRELDERSSNKYSRKSLETIETVPSYAMKPIYEQKQVLKKQGILEYFDFTFVEWLSTGRTAPGDIKMFTNWFATTFVPHLESNESLNIFIITHAGVLYDYAKESFPNNTGFILKTEYLDGEMYFKPYISLSPFIPSDFSSPKDTIYGDKNYYCPSDRCPGICTMRDNGKTRSVLSLLECGNSSILEYSE